MKPMSGLNARASCWCRTFLKLFTFRPLLIWWSKEENKEYWMLDRLLICLSTMDRNWVIALLFNSAALCEKESSFLSVLQLLRIVLFIVMDKLWLMNYCTSMLWMLTWWHWLTVERLNIWRQKVCIFCFIPLNPLLNYYLNMIKTVLRVFIT